VIRTFDDIAALRARLYGAEKGKKDAPRTHTRIVPMAQPAPRTPPTGSGGIRVDIPARTTTTRSETLETAIPIGVSPATVRAALPERKSAVVPWLALLLFAIALGYSLDSGK
jgi:hypothetical protein